jgi:hypothetical protein
MPKAWFSFLSVVNKRSSSVKSLVLLSILFFSFAQAQEKVDISALPELEIHFVQKNGEGDHYQIGDRITLYVELLPTLAGDSKEFSFAVPEGSSSLADQGWYVDPTSQFLANNLSFVVSPIQIGKLILPTLLLAKDDKTAIARTHSITIQVTGPEKKEKESKLIDILAIPLATKYVILFSALALLLAGLIAWALVRYLKNKKMNHKIPPAPVVKKEADHVIAFRSLENLYKKYPYSEQNLKPLTFGISEVLKEYFSARFEVDAKESTTDEMLALLRTEAVPQDGLKEIRALFQELDLVKFTKVNDAVHVSETTYQEYKVKAQGIIQRWAGA